MTQGSLSNGNITNGHTTNGSILNGHTAKSYATVTPYDGERKVLIIGAGSTGLALAQGLKKANIPHAIYERDENANRQRNWSMGLHWAIPALEALMPDDFISRIQYTQVDPNVPTSDADQLPFINGQTGERIGEIKSSKFYRLRRDKIRRLLMEGLKVNWGKGVSDVVYSADRSKVTARFADGTEDTGSLLIGTDGAHSTMRTLLLGAETAKTTPTDFATTMCFTKHTRERALFLRDKPFHPLYQVSPHPNGYFGWLSLHDGDDVEHPENWTFFHYISYPESRDVENTKTDAEHLAYQKELAKSFCDPFRSVFEWTPDDSPVWYGKLRQWDPSQPGRQWDNQDGLITLAGDSAHPMTFQRGQGLNHALKDAYEMCKTVEGFWKSGSFSTEERKAAITAYEQEMIPRGGEEVRLSEANSVAMHDWQMVMQSPSVNKGMHVPFKAAR
ncbi:MAG: hypothetical protein Q9220_001591 [cf. Caloplaca sp. 1 TL-2023]